jgi:hypothetical protein
MESPDNESRRAAGLTWRYDGDGWTAEDETGNFRLVELAPGRWTEFWTPLDFSCGCGVQARGGRDWPDFETAARAAVALARQAS